MAGPRSDPCLREASDPPLGVEFPSISAGDRRGNGTAVVGQLLSIPAGDCRGTGRDLCAQSRINSQPRPRHQAARAPWARCGQPAVRTPARCGCRQYTLPMPDTFAAPMLDALAAPMPDGGTFTAPTPGNAPSNADGGHLHGADGGIRWRAPSRRRSRTSAPAQRRCHTAAPSRRRCRPVHPHGADPEQQHFHGTDAGEVVLRGADAGHRHLYGADAGQVHLHGSNAGQRPCTAPVPDKCTFTAPMPDSGTSRCRCRTFRGAVGDKSRSSQHAPGTMGPAWGWALARARVAAVIYAHRLRFRTSARLFLGSAV